MKIVVAHLDFCSRKGVSMELTVEFYFDGFDPTVLEGYEFTLEGRVLKATGQLDDLMEILHIIDVTTTGDRYVCVR